MLAELRVFRESDAAALFELIQKNQNYLRKWFQWANDVESVQDTKKFIKESIQKYRRTRAFDAGIWYEGELAGAIGFHEINWQHRNVEIGYWLGENYQGHGLVTQAVVVFLSHAFVELKLNRIEIICVAHNKKSRAVAERLGFQCEGLHREGQFLRGVFVDELWYSLLARDYWSRYEEFTRYLRPEQPLLRMRA